jgi:hypothetical protein
MPKKGSRETDMPTSYDGTLLDHLAEHMVYLSAASSFWFSLNSSYDHGCHLSKRLGMSPQDYEYLLVAANLAQFHPKWGFSIKILKWKVFLQESVFDNQLHGHDGSFIKEVGLKRIRQRNKTHK